MQFLHCSAEHSLGASWNRKHIFVEPWPKPLSLQPTPLNIPGLPPSWHENPLGWKYQWGIVSPQGGAH